MGDSVYSDKFDTIDLVITALKEHEKMLDSVCNKLETLVDRLGVKEPDKISEPSSLISCNKWHDFKHRCKGANVVTFDITNNILFIYAKLNGEVFRYSEKIPRNSFRGVDEGKGFLVTKILIEDIETLPFFNGTLRCGLRLSVKTSKSTLTDGEFLLTFDYESDSDKVKEFLSRELSVPKNNIVEGKITV